MATVFSGDEIIKLAVKTEVTGYEFYKTALNKASNDGLKKLFKYLADAELKHKAMYEGLKDIIREPAQGVPSDWDELDLYVQAMVDSSFFIGGEKNINMATRAADDKSAVDFALGFEKDTLLFFYQILDVVKPANKLIIEKIISEEKDHIRKLAEIKKSL